MSLAVLRVMLLGLARDRGALAMTFLVPAVFFLVFASIFAASSGRAFVPRVAVGVQGDSTGMERFFRELAGPGTLSLAASPEGDPAAVREMVRSGRADVGLVVHPGGGAGLPGFTVIVDPARDVAAQVLRAAVQRAFAVSFLVPPALAGDGATFGAAMESQSVAGTRAGSSEVAYSAGAVALLFLLLSAVYGAVSLFEERDSGIVERLVAGPSGTRPLVDGKFLYLTAVGVVQAGVIFGLAWALYGVDVPARAAAWSLTTLLSAAAAAGLALALTTAFPTRHQALTIGNVTVLILSALGGSMIPRFLMPPLLRRAGWVTPNAWAVEAYTSIFWRGDPWTALVLPLALLAGVALLGLAVARRNARRLEAL